MISDKDYNDVIVQCSRTPKITMFYGSTCVKMLVCDLWRKSEAKFMCKYLCAVT